MKRQNDGLDVHGKAPGFWFYPADFERDLQILSLTAQGLWIRMLGWMHFCEKRGYLELPTGIPMNNDDVAARVGKTVKEVTKAISEMERIGLFSRDERGCMFNRRMARDTHISIVRKEAAAARLLAASRDQDGKFAPANGDFAPPNSPQITVPSSSDSDSVSSSDSPKGKNTERPVSFPPNQEPRFDYTAGFRELWDLWPSKARTKIIDSQRLYVETVSPDPARLHESLVAPVRPGGKWAESANWRRGYVCAIAEYIRNRRDLEEPESFEESQKKQGAGVNTSAKKSAFERALENA